MLPQKKMFVQVESVFIDYAAIFKIILVQWYRKCKKYFATSKGNDYGSKLGKWEMHNVKLLH